MAIDPAKFSPMAVSDTCAVWNMLSSRKLFQAAKDARVHFCITPMVLFECILKPRSIITPEKQELITRFEKAQKDGYFPIQECDLDDLALLARQAPGKLGSGEMSCIATAYRIRNIAFMTDEKKARTFAENNLRLTVETTPKLYAWLHYKRFLSDGDHQDIINEHENYEKMPLSKYFEEAFETALRCRLF
jgi:predicted nucleic acid-binding protein